MRRWALIASLALAALALAAACGDDDECGGEIVNNCATECSPSCGSDEVVQCGAYPYGDLESDLRCCECVPE